MKQGCGNDPPSEVTRGKRVGSSIVWLMHLSYKQETGGSNPLCRTDGASE